MKLTPNETGTLLVEALPALLNILLGFLGVFLFGRTARQQRSIVALLRQAIRDTAAHSLRIGRAAPAQAVRWIC